MLKPRTPLLALTFLLVPLGLAFAPRADRVAFEPAEGSTVTRQLDVELKVAVDELRVRVEGQEMPVPMDEIGKDLILTSAMRVADRFLSARDGRVIELVRTYESITIRGGPRGEMESMDKADELVGKPVRFLWDEDDAEYDITYAEDGKRGDPELLEGLHPDMDFTVLLPDREVSEGDTWTVSGEEVALLFFPGGALMPDDDDGQFSAIFESTLQPQIEQAFRDFQVLCTYKGTREAGGARVGEITFTFRSSIALDLTEAAEAMAREASKEAPFQLDFDIEANVELDLDGSGQLLWHLAQQRAHGFDMKSDMILQFETSAEMRFEGESQSFDASGELSGTGTWKMTTE